MASPHSCDSSWVSDREGLLASPQTELSMRLFHCLIVALGAICAIGTSALTARAQQEAVRQQQAEAAAPRMPAAKPNPMKVTLVRSGAAGCEPACAEWISAQGQIDEATPEEFRRVFARLGERKLPVLIDSIGGEVDASLTIGRMIRARGLDVFVTKTIIEPCAATSIECKSLQGRGIQTGRAEAHISKCASACAFVLAGGVRRYVGAWTLVGLHEIKAISTLRLVRQHYRIERRDASSAQSMPQKRIIKEELLKVETREGPAEERTYAKVGRYFADMGISPAIMPIMRAAPNSSIHWLKIAELKTTGLATDFINGEQFLSAAAATIVPAGAPPCSLESGPAPPCTTSSITQRAQSAVPPARAAAMQTPPISRTTVASGQLPAPRTVPPVPIQRSLPVRPQTETPWRFPEFGN